MSAAPLSYLFTEDVYEVPGSIAVIVNKPWEKFSDDERSLLAKILGSVKVNLASVRIIARPNITQAEMVSLGSHRILIFGSQADISPYQLVQAQGFSAIKADDLLTLDDAKKKSLWLALKAMFTP